MTKKTLVIGASTNPERYSHKCIVKLRQNNIETVAVGLRKGKVEDVEIHNNFLDFNNIHTINIYVSAKNLVTYEDYILRLRPKRVIFPPGTENPEFEATLTQAGILNERACPLVMLSVGNY